MRKLLTHLSVYLCLYQQAYGDAEPASKRWISKAIKTVTFKKRVSHQDIAEHYGKTKEVIIDNLLEDPQFTMKVVDFNLYFLGAKTEDLFSGYNFEFDNKVLSWPTALESAYKLAQGEGHDSLFNYLLSTYLSPPLNKRKWQPNMPTEFSSLTTEAEFWAMDPSKLRVLTMNNYITHLQEAKTFIQENSAPEACEKLKDLSSKKQVGSLLRQIWGISRSLNSIYPTDPFYIGQNVDCTTFEISENLKEYVNNGIKNANTLLSLLPKLKIRSDRFSYTFDEFTSITNAPTEGNFNGTGFTFSGFWTSNNNNSTNFNRKRGAAILKTFFCDDLIPVGAIDLPQDHAGDRHASERTCQACHYKLDPMAGFFKNHGLLGINFATLTPEFRQLIREFYQIESDTFFIFDDALIIQDSAVESYTDTWRSEEGPREWEIGYIRSQTNQNHNMYGKDLQDLFHIIKQAPEVKRCLVQRMAEYYIDQKQTFSGKWLDSLTEIYTNDQKMGYHKVVKQLLMSQAFDAVNRDPQRCYDTVESKENEAELPCTIGYTVEKYCQTCHNASDAQGGLDMTQWVRNGNKYMFSHKKGDILREASQSFQLIKSRLSTGNLSQRMPFGIYMPSTERQKLFVWISKQL